MQIFGDVNLARKASILLNFQISYLSSEKEILRPRGPQGGEI